MSVPWSVRIYILCHNTNVNWFIKEENCFKRMRVRERRWDSLKVTFQFFPWTIFSLNNLHLFYFVLCAGLCFRCSENDGFGAKYDLCPFYLILSFKMNKMEIDENARLITKPVVFFFLLFSVLILMTHNHTHPARHIHTAYYTQPKGTRNWEFVHASKQVLTFLWGSHRTAMSLTLLPQSKMYGQKLFLSFRTQKHLTWYLVFVMILHTHKAFTQRRIHNIYYNNIYYLSN